MKILPLLIVLEVFQVLLLISILRKLHCLNRARLKDLTNDLSQSTDSLKRTVDRNKP